MHLTTSITLYIKTSLSRACRCPVVCVVSAVISEHSDQASVRQLICHDLWPAHTSARAHAHSQTHNQLTCRRRGVEWRRQERRHSISPGSSWLAGWRVWCGQIEDKGAFIIGKTHCRHLGKERERERKNEKEREGTRNDVRNCVLITAKMPLPPTPCLCAALCQLHKGSPTVFNNSRAKRRQMGQRWWSRRCHCEPAERK